MKAYYQIDPWKIIENEFQPQHHKGSESIFSIGNGWMGQRANFEEHYSGSSLQGNYFAGVYYPDKTKVGWWKNGYPEYFAKVLNGTNWIGIEVLIDGDQIDLAEAIVTNFKRTLDMKKGVLQRELTAELKNGRKFRLEAERFISMKDFEIGAISFSITPLNFNGSISLTPFLDGDVKNEDSNYEEKFWDEVVKKSNGKGAFLTIKTKKLDFHLCSGMNYNVYINDKEVSTNFNTISSEKYIGQTCSLTIEKGEKLTIEKIVANLSTMNYSKDSLLPATVSSLESAMNKGYKKLYSDHVSAWDEKWLHSDIIIEGDDAAQQGIRFNIFQLMQTYTGVDERLNIGPKGFTGEKYGGSTYWDTEAYALPFYMCTTKQDVSRNLLIYRHKQLQKAIENGEKLGFNKGAALYPMVTMNGEECHNEWEITFEEIHRNGAIAFAINNYIKHTEDKKYLAEYGLEVLIAISRFWTQRTTFSEIRQKYVILGVTGPNEYENNVNNNWYTNTIATWTLRFTIDSLFWVKENFPTEFQSLSAKIRLDTDTELAKWKDIILRMHYPVIENSMVVLQQDGYLDKENITVKDLRAEDRPLNQKWSWDRILRSPFIKQADVLQGMYFLEDEYSEEQIRINFDFYEPRTVHESSLSPCVHSILAAKLKKSELAYNMYLRTARLDLDDYNNEVHEGLHITSMAGTWMSIVEGFGGKRIKDQKLSFNPIIPNQWKSYSFKIIFRNRTLKVQITSSEISIKNLEGDTMDVLIFDKVITIPKGEMVTSKF